MAWVYILECADGSYYTGSTIDLERRLAEHELGIGANYTRRRLPMKLVFADQTESIETAFVREKQVQGWSRAKKRAVIESRGASLPELSQRRTPNSGSLREPQGPDGR
jgi:putative endonuclease